MHCWVCKNCQILYTLDGSNLSAKVAKVTLFFCTILLCDWPRKPASLSQPIRFKIKTNCDPTHFLHLRAVFYFLLWVLILVIFPPYDWLFYVIWVYFYITQLKSILFVGFFVLLHSPPLYSAFLLCALPSSLFTLLALLHSMLCKRKRMPFTLPNPIRSKT